jgi:DNA-binding transcriptional MerR regulator
MTKPNISDLRRMSVAEAMRAFGLTARAIRYYDQVGLIEAARDRANARVFDAMARRRLGWISKLRQADISLSDIDDVLSAEEQGGDARTCALMKLEARRHVLERDLQQIGAVIADLREPGRGALRPIGAIAR